METKNTNMTQERTQQQENVSAIETEPQKAGQQVNVNVFATPVIKGKPVKKVPYVLLAFFLGGLGIHNFYAGRTGLGILYLLFCWTLIPSFDAFVQAIIGLCKESDVNGYIVV